MSDCQEIKELNNKIQQLIKLNTALEKKSQELIY